MLALFGTADAVGETHLYTIEVDAQLGRMHVVAKFDTAVSRVAARSDSAERFLIGAKDCDRDQEIDTRRWRMRLPSAGITCLSYTVDLNKAAQADQRNEILDDSNVVISPTVWMWRPSLRGDDEIHIRFRLPDGVQVSMPWPAIAAEENAFRLIASPQSGPELAVFGRIESAVTRATGTDLRIILLRSGDDYDTAEIVDWIRATANNITLVYGRFPEPSVRIVVFPIGPSPWGGDAPVHFGRVVRNGGATVELLIDPWQPMQAFYDDWTATHEFTHMMLPYVQRKQRWISEGFAQYYQNVLLARAGRYTQRYAWQKISAGLERGRLSAPELSPNEAAAGQLFDGRMKIYWSGAALALMADVELRRRSDGAQSLDTVLDQLQRCCLPSRNIWSGTELFAKLDTFVGEPLFMNLYRQYADAEGFPDVRPLLGRLGVEVGDDDAQLSDSAELAEIRAAISAQRYTDESGQNRYPKNDGQ